MQEHPSRGEFVGGDGEGAVVEGDLLVQFGADKGKETGLLREWEVGVAVEEAAESELGGGYFLEWPWRSIIIRIRELVPLSLLM